MLRFISAFTVSHIVRYGVHSRRDAQERQHLYLKKVKKMRQTYKYQAFLIFFIQILTL